MALKEQLEAAGYDTSGLDEGALLEKLEAAGYDTSSLRQPEQSGTMQMIGDQVKKSLGGPLGMAGQAEQIIQQTANKAGDYIEENLDSTIPGADKAAGMLTKAAPAIVQMAVPTIAGAKAVKNSALGKALTPGGRASVGESIGAAEAAAGVEPVVPTVSNMAKRLDLPTRERSFADIVTAMTKKIKDGEKITPQDLADFRDLVKQQYRANKIAKGTRLDALTAKANNEAGEMLNKAVPGRGAASAKYAKIKKIQERLKKFGKYGVSGAGALGVGGFAYKALKG